MGRRRAPCCSRRHSSPKRRCGRRSQDGARACAPAASTSSARCGARCTRRCARYACASTRRWAGRRASWWRWSVCRRPDSERGVALVAALTALALMSVLALGLAETSTLDERLAEKSLAALQAEALARSGVAGAALGLAEAGAAGGPHPLRAPGAVDVGRHPPRPGWVGVHVEDEGRRLGLTAP